MGAFCRAVDFEEECCCQIAKEDDSIHVRVLASTELEVGECLLPRCKLSTDIYRRTWQRPLVNPTSLYSIK